MVTSAITTMMTIFSQSASAVLCQMNSEPTHGRNTIHTSISSMSGSPEIQWYTWPRVAEEAIQRTAKAIHRMPNG